LVVGVLLSLSPWQCPVNLPLTCLPGRAAYASLGQPKPGLPLASPLWDVSQILDNRSKYPCSSGTVLSKLQIRVPRNHEPTTTNETGSSNRTTTPNQQQQNNNNNIEDNNTNIKVNITTKHRCSNQGEQLPLDCCIYV
jgi:hypothetical protein